MTNAIRFAIVASLLTSACIPPQPGYTARYVSQDCGGSYSYVTGLCAESSAPAYEQGPASRGYNRGAEHSAPASSDDARENVLAAREALRGVRGGGLEGGRGPISFANGCENGSHYLMVDNLGAKAAAITVTGVVYDPRRGRQNVKFRAGMVAAAARKGCGQAVRKPVCLPDNWDVDTAPVVQVQYITRGRGGRPIQDSSDSITASLTSDGWLASIGRCW